MPTKFNTKTLVGIILTTLGLTVSSFSNAFDIPRGFYEIESGNAVYLFDDSNDNYVLTVDLSKGARLSHKTFGFSNGMYLRDNSYGKLDGGAYALVNGAFFNSDMTPYTNISFPFTPGNNIWKSTSENTKTLCIKQKNGIQYAVMDKTGYNQRDYSKACLFSFTALDPSVDKNSTASIGRTYIGVTKDFTTVMFFVSNSKTHSQMLDIMNLWGIPNYHILMGDGSASSQIVTRRNSNYGIARFLKIPYETQRKIPHMIQVFDK